MFFPACSTYVTLLIFLLVLLFSSLLSSPSLHLLIHLLIDPSYHSVPPPPLQKEALTETNVGPGQCCEGVASPSGSCLGGFSGLGYKAQAVSSQ